MEIYEAYSFSDAKGEIQIRMALSQQERQIHLGQKILRLSTDISLYLENATRYLHIVSVTTTVIELPSITPHGPNFSVWLLLHISGTAEARVFKFRKQIEYQA